MLGTELRDFYKAEIKLDKVFADIEKDLQACDRVVCQFIVNGLEFSENDEQKFSGMSIGEIETLEYLTEDKAIIHFQVAEGWVEALPELISASEKLAEKIRVGGTRSLWKEIKDLSDNCLFLVSSLDTLRSLVGDRYLSALTNWSVSENNLLVAAKHLTAAAENKDEKKLAIVLDFDLPSALENWREVLVKLLELFNRDKIKASC